MDFTDLTFWTRLDCPHISMMATSAPAGEEIRAVEFVWTPVIKGIIQTLESIRPREKRVILGESGRLMLQMGYNLAQSIVQPIIMAIPRPSGEKETFNVDLEKLFHRLLLRGAMVHLEKAVYDLVATYSLEILGEDAFAQLEDETALLVSQVWSIHLWDTPQVVAEIVARYHPKA